VCGVRDVSHDQMTPHHQSIANTCIHTYVHVRMQDAGYRVYLYLQHHNGEKPELPLTGPALPVEPLREGQLL
jgi:hypothetical protein